MTVQGHQTQKFPLGLSVCVCNRGCMCVSGVYGVQVSFYVYQRGCNESDIFYFYCLQVRKKILKLKLWKLAVGYMYVKRKYL